MKYINQLEYPHIPYRTRTKDDSVKDKSGDVAKSGCGLCSICMILEHLIDVDLSIEECVAISDACEANHSVGTDMSILAPVIAERYGLDYRNTNDLSEAIEHLRCGGEIIAHMGVPEGKEVGILADVGHYVCLIATDGKEFCVLDPAYTPEKYAHPYRAGRVNVAHAPFLYAPIDLVYEDARPGRVRYHLFSRKKD